MQIAAEGQGAGSREQGAGGVKQVVQVQKLGNLFSGVP